MNERIPEISILISRANDAYYNTGSAILDDAAYDALKEELSQLDPGNPLLKQVGANVPRDSILTKVRHSIPMGSQNKAMTRGEFYAWVESLPGGRATRLGCSFKMDGGSVSLEYADGRLSRAVTRGDGKDGLDITANVLRFHGVPLHGVRGPDGGLFSGFVRGEIILPTREWGKVDPEMSTNPRNLGNGIAGRKDGSQSEKLTVYAFRAHLGNGETIAATQEEMFRLMGSMGFNVSRCMTGTVDDVWNFFEKTRTERTSLPFWIDGLVVAVDDIRVQAAMGINADCPKGQIAVKFPAPGADTTVESVEITVGHTGAMIPTARLRPVAIGGTTVSAALLCNWEEIAALGVAIGDEVRVVKSGDIIPKIISVLKEGDHRTEISMPCRCPVCGGPVGRKANVDGEDSVNLYCLNDECDAKTTGKIKRWIRSLEILGIGDELLTALVDSMGIKDAADLYRLKDRAREMANLSLGAGVRLGEKRAAKVIADIEARRELTIEQFVGSLGIDALGKRRVELIRQAVPGQMDELADWTSGKLLRIANQAGVPNVAERMVTDLARRKGLIDRLVFAGVTVKEKTVKAAAPAAALRICLTGTLSQPREMFVGKIKAAGYAFKDSVSKDLDYLVLADPSSNSSKALKARKLGVKCIGEAELLSLLGQA